MKHDFIDHHREGDSPIHLADPRLKIIMMVTYIFVVVLIPRQAKHFFLALSAIPLLLALISGISVFHFLSKLLKIYPMIFFITFLLPFFKGTEPAVFQWSIFKIYPAGLDKFVLINLKSVLSVFMSVILTTTTSFDMLLKGLEELRIPKIFILILSFMYRFIFLLIDEVERMLTAFQSRYIRLKLLTRLKFVAQQIGVLFIRTFERGERIYQAMEARGFSGNIYTLHSLCWKKSDNILLTGYILLLILPFLVFPK